MVRQLMPHFATDPAAPNTTFFDNMELLQVLSFFTIHSQNTLPWWANSHMHNLMLPTTGHAAANQARQIARDFCAR
jgi:hypothetical protein